MSWEVFLQRCPKSWRGDLCYSVCNLHVFVQLFLRARWILTIWMLVDELGDWRDRSWFKGRVAEHSLVQWVLNFDIITDKNCNLTYALCASSGERERCQEYGNLNGIYPLEQQQTIHAKWIYCCIGVRVHKQFILLSPDVKIVAVLGANTDDSNCL